MNCYFCGGSRPVVRVELDTSVELDVSVNGSCGDCVSADSMLADSWNSR